MQLFETMLVRRSGRMYTNKKISENTIHSILEAGLLAPTSRNLKSVDFICVSDEAALTFLASAKNAGGGMPKEASHAIIVIGDSAKDDVWVEDCAIAMTYMMLRATDLGIANCWVQCRNRWHGKPGEPECKSAECVIQEYFGIPSDYKVLAVLSLGHAAAEIASHSAEEADFAKVHWDCF